MAASELIFSIRKEFFEKKVSGEVDLALISYFHLQTEEPESM